jgi:hypothetical protein
VLSEKDEAGLRDLLAASQADPGLAGLRPVGWYRSRTRSGISLSEDDNVLHSRHFTEPGQVVLVLRPEHGGLARAEFFARASDGTMTGGHEFALAPPTRRRTPGMVPRTAPRPEKRPEPELPRFLRVAEAQVSRRRLPSLSWRWLAVMLTLVFVGIGVAGRSYEQPEPPAPKTPDIQLRAVDVNGQLVITWDRQAVPVVKSRKAVLSISDGINKSALDLDRDAVTKGSVTYVRRSGRVDVRLRVSCEREHVEEVALFLGEPVPREGDVVRDNALDEPGGLRTAAVEPQPKLPFTAQTRRRGEN